MIIADAAPARGRRLLRARRYSLATVPVVALAELSKDRKSHSPAHSDGDLARSSEFGHTGAEILNDRRDGNGDHNLAACRSVDEMPAVGRLNHGLAHELARQVGARSGARAVTARRLGSNRPLNRPPPPCYLDHPAHPSAGFSLDLN